MQRTRPVAFIAAILGICACLGSTATGLDRSRSISQFEHRAWRSKDGAPSQIHALAQTADGYLWIGSAQGLFRFDAVTFEEYVPQPGVTLPSHNIYALMATPEGGLWVAFRPSGLGFLEKGRLTVLADADLPADPRVHHLARDESGRIWAGTESGLFVREGARWTAVGDDWGARSEMSRALYVDRRGTLWFATVNTISYLPKGATKFLPTAMAVKRGLTAFAEDRDGRVWFVEDELGMAGPVPLQGDRLGAMPTIASATLNQLLFDRDGALWITGLNSSRIMRIRYPERLPNRTIGPADAELESFDEWDGPSVGQAYKLLEDREGNIWVGSSNGLDRFRQSEVVAMRLPKTYQGLTLLPGDAGDLWIGNNDSSPLLRVDGTTIASESNPVGARAASVFRAANGDVWWGCYDGLWRQRGQRFEFFALPPGVAHDYIYEIFPSAGDSGLQVRLGDVGLVHFKDGTWNLNSRPAGLPDIGPSASYVDHDGRIWLGYRLGDVYLLEPDRVTHFTARDGLNVGRIKVIRGLGDHIWIGGELGPMLFAQGRFHNIKTADGEPFGAVSGIVETTDSGLWLNELRGIEHIAADEVQQLLRDPSQPVAYRRYNYLDGVLAPPQMNFTNSTAVRGQDGRLWFATDNGILWIDPGYEVRNVLPPPVSLLSIRTETGRLTSFDDLTFAAGTRTIEVDYTALSLSVPERIGFRYKLDGVDEDWQDVGNRRQAYYTNMQPGRYRFRVIASNNDGVWNQEGATFEFEILPPWWSTLWLKTSGGLGLLLMAYAGYSYRVRQIASQFEWRLQERLAERSRIARELHDTLIQGFQGLMFRLQAVRDLLPSRSGDAITALDIALERGTQAIAEGRDAVQGLRSAAAGRVDLVQGLRLLAQDLAVAQEGREVPAFRMLVEGSSTDPDPLLLDDICRIAGEALTNAFRHARASEIEARVTYGHHVIRVLIRDNGVGIEARVRNRGGRDGHWGLTGMRERAEALGGRLEVWSQEGAGTEVDLVIPTKRRGRRLWRIAKFPFFLRSEHAREQS